MCFVQLKLPHVDWGRVLEADMYQAPSFKLAQGYERLHMPGGIQVRIEPLNIGGRFLSAACQHGICGQLTSHLAPIASVAFVF